MTKGEVAVEAGVKADHEILDESENKAMVRVFLNLISN